MIANRAIKRRLKDYEGERIPYSVINGKKVPGTPIDLSFKGVILPVTGSELRVLPEGLGERGVRKIYTFTELKKNSSSYAGDLVFYEGYKWLVWDVKKRNYGDFYISIITKQNRLTT